MKLQENARAINKTGPIPFSVAEFFQWANKEQEWNKNLNVSSAFPAEITAVKNGLLGNVDNQNSQSGDIMYLPHCCLWCDFVLPCTLFSWHISTNAFKIL